MATTETKWEAYNSYGIAIFPYNIDRKFHIEIETGDVVAIEERAPGWFKGFIYRKGMNADSVVKKGVFPSSYILLWPENDVPLEPLAREEKHDDDNVKSDDNSKIDDNNNDHNNNNDNNNNDNDEDEKNQNDFSNQKKAEQFPKLNILGDTTDVFANEVMEVMEEWSTEMKLLLKDQKFSEFESVASKLSDLLKLRNSIIRIYQNIKNQQHQHSSHSNQHQHQHPSGSGTNASSSEMTEPETEDLDLDTTDLDSSADPSLRSTDHFSATSSSSFDPAGHHGIEQKLTRYHGQMTRLIDEGYDVLQIPAPMRVRRGSHKGKRASDTNMGIVQLYRLYRNNQRRKDLRSIKDTIVTEKRKLLHTRTKKVKIDIAENDVYNLNEQLYQLALNVEQITLEDNSDNEWQVIFSLCSAEDHSIQAEEYLINLDQHAQPKTPPPHSTLFKDVAKASLASQLFVVCRIYRRGNLSAKKGRREKAHVVVRPFAMAVVPLSSSVVDAMSADVYQVNMTSFFELKEEGFNRNVIDDRNAVKQRQIRNANINIRLGMRLFPMEYNEALKEAPELRDASMTQMLDFPDVISPGDMRNDFYITLRGGSFHDTKKRNLQVKTVIKLKDGVSPEKCLSRFPRRIENSRSMEYRSATLYHQASPLWNEVVKVSLEPEQLEKATAIFVFYHVPKTKDNFKPIGISFLPLRAESGALIQDQTDLDLPVLKYKDGAEKINNYDEYVNDPTMQTKNVFNVNVKLLSTRATHNEHIYNLLHWNSVREHISMKQILSDLLFQSSDPRESTKFLRAILDTLFTIESEEENNEELSRMVFDVLVKVIDRLQVGRGDQFTKQQRKIDEYLNQHFSFPNAHKWIVRWLRVYFQEDTKNLRNIAKTLGYLFRFVAKSRAQYEELMRYEGMEDELEQDTLKNDVREILSKISELFQAEQLSQPSIMVITSQLMKTGITHFYDSIFDLFHDDHLFGEAVRDYLESSRQILASGNETNEMTRFTSIGSTAKGQVLRRHASRQIVLPHLVRELQPQLLNVDKSLSDVEKRRTRDTSDTVSHILVSMLHGIESGDRRHLDDAFVELLHLGPQLFEGIKRAQVLFEEARQDLENTMRNLSEAHDTLKNTPSKNAFVNCQTLIANLEDKDRIHKLRYTVYLDLIACFMSIFHHSNVEVLHKFMNSHSLKEQSKILNQWFSFHEHLLNPMHNPIPHSWIILSSYQLRTSLRFITTSVRLLQHSFSLPELSPAESAQLRHRYGRLVFGREPFEGTPVEHDRHVRRQAWEDLFRFVQSFILAPRLQMEHYDTVSERNVFKCRTRHDMRREAVHILQETWENLGERQIQLLLAVVPVVIRLMLVVNEDVVRTSVDVLERVLERDYSINGNFETTEAVACYSIHNMFEKSLLNSQLENAILVGLPKQLRSSSLSARTDTIESTFTTILSCIPQTVRLPNTEEENKTTALATAMRLLRRLPDKSLYFEYVHKLEHMHIENGNLVEAGMAVLLHADMLSFHSPRMLASFLGFSEQREHERKRDLYQKAIQHLDQGKGWERAIFYQQHLNDYYRRIRFDYQQISKGLQNVASMFKNILSIRRFPLSDCVYHIAYYGGGFADVQLQNKEFIVKGKEGERTSDLRERLKSRFPQAKIQMDPAKPVPPEAHEPDSQYITLKSVKPSSMPEIEMKPMELHKHKQGFVLEHERSDNVDVFAFTRTYLSDKKREDDNNVDITLTDVNYFQTDYPIPSPFNIFKVVKKGTHTRSPIENAVVDVEQKIMEIHRNIVAHDHDYKVDFNELTRQLTGTIDAAVMGGISKYISAFFDPSWIRDNPHELENLRRFQRALRIMMSILDRGLQVRRDILKNQESDLATQLEGSLARTQKELTEVLTRNITTVQ